METNWSIETSSPSLFLQHLSSCLSPENRWINSRNYLFVWKLFLFLKNRVSGRHPFALCTSRFNQNLSLVENFMELLLFFGTSVRKQVLVLGHFRLKSCEGISITKSISKEKRQQIRYQSRSTLPWALSELGWSRKNLPSWSLVKDFTFTALRPGCLNCSALPMSDHITTFSYGHQSRNNLTKACSQLGRSRKHLPLWSYLSGSTLTPRRPGSLQNYSAHSRP